MATVEEAFAAWLANDVKGLLRREAKKKKEYRDRPDTSSNDADAEGVIDKTAMEKVSRTFIKEQKKSDDKDLRNKISEQIEQNKRPTLKPVEETPQAEAAMDGPVKLFLREDEKLQRAEQRKQIRNQLKENKEPAKTSALGPITDEQVEAVNPPEKEEPTLANIDLTPQPKPAEPVAEKPLEVTLPEQAVETEAPKQLDPVTKSKLANLDVAVSSAGPVQDVTLAKPADQLDDSEGNQDFSDLSKSFIDATQRDVSILGQQVPKGTTAYDIAEASQRMMMSANASIPALPMAARRVGAYLFKPYDAVAGTKLFEKHNQTTDQMESFIRGTGLVKDPETFAERAAFALGSVAIPFPGASAATVATAPGKALAAEMMLPGTIVRQGQSLAGTYAASAIGSVGINEGLYQTLQTIDRLQKYNPPVPNSQGDVEPRVLSVDANEARDIQKKINMTRDQFVSTFAGATYGDVAINTLAGLAGIALAVKTGGKVLGKAVEGRVIRDPAKPTPDLTPQSVTTASEAARSMGQDANNVLESQAKRAGNENLARDISTQTRSGAAARMEYMHDTGSVEIPGYQFQLSVSPKSLVEHHLSLPPKQQADLDWAFATMDQVDHATVQGLKKNPNATGGPGMPAQADIQRAQSILALPENAQTVKAMSEMREAILGSMEAMGRYNPATTSLLRQQRPNYAHIIETGDYVVENGVSRPMTYVERIKAGLNRKTRQVIEGNELPDDIDVAQARTQVTGPNQRLSPVLSNVIALRETAEFALQNDIRIRFIDTLKNDADMSRSVRQLNPNQKAPHDSGLVEVWRNGEKERYALEPIVADALSYNPFRTNNGLATVKNITQSLTTGVFAPWFAATSATMEAVLGSVTRKRGTRLGYIDQALQAATGGRMPVPGDVLGTAAAMVTAGLNTVRANSVLKATQAIEKAILADPNLQVNQLAQAVGPDYVKQVSRGLALGQNVVMQDIVDNGRKLYANSAKGTGNRLGALHSSSNEMMRNVNEFNNKTVKDSYLRELGGESGSALYKAMQGYLKAVADVHDLTKLAYIQQNKGRIADNVLAHETRNLGGDLGKRGLGFSGTGYKLRDETSTAARTALKTVANEGVGGLADVARDSIRYYNPHVQGVTRVLESFKRQPATTVAGIAAGITVPYLGSLAVSQALGPEYVDYLLNRREEWRKTNYLYMPVPGRPPEEGINIRIDPALSVFGYPTLEVLDSVFGIRKLTAAQLQKQPLDAESTGVAHALSDGLKEFVGIGYPWPMELAAATQGIAVRNIMDPGFARGSEKLSGVGGEGQYTSSALSASTQLMLESIVGVVGKAGIHGLDAWVSTSDKDSNYIGKAANVGKQVAYDLSGQVPGARSVPFFGQFAQPNTYTESATGLARNTRDMISAGKKIMKAVEQEEKALLNTKTNAPDGQMAVPNLRQGYVGEVEIPDDAKQAYQAVKQVVGAKGELASYFSERRRISVALDGLRAVNAGNISRHVIVPLQNGAIDGVNYVILLKDKLNEEAAAEKYAIENPTMTKGSAPDAKRYVAPKVAADSRQRPKPLNDRLGNVPTEDQINSMAVPTLAQVSRLRNVLNKRRYSLDRQAVASINELEKKSGIKLVDLAKKIKLAPGGLDDDDED